MRARGASARLALGLWLAACAALACSGQEAESGAEPASDPDAKQLAPDFALPDLAGEEISLRSLRGRTVLIDFWATWCAPCVHQIPVLNEFQKSHRDDGVVVLGISVDAEGREVVAPFAERHDIRYRVLLGTESIARRFGAPGFPSLVAIGPEGRIESLHVGVVDREALEAIVEGIAREGDADPDLGA